jgi:hypothetical protein
MAPWAVRRDKFARARGPCYAGRKSRLPRDRGEGTIVLSWYVIRFPSCSRPAFLPVPCGAKAARPAAKAYARTARIRAATGASRKQARCRIKTQLLTITSRVLQSAEIAFVLERLSKSTCICIHLWIAVAGPHSRVSIKSSLRSLTCRQTRHRGRSCPRMSSTRVALCAA